VHLTAEFHHPTFNRSELVIVLTDKLTNKQTMLKTSASLRYATLVGNKHSNCWAGWPRHNDSRNQTAYKSRPGFKIV